MATTSSSITDAQLQALLAIADGGSFTEAARRLRLTQSAVSHAISSLEEALRVSLIERSAQGVRLTGIGERTASQARELLRLKRQMQQDAESARRHQHGQLRIGSFGASASRRLLPPLLDAFSTRYPGIDMLVSEGADDEVVRWLADGVVDVAFVTMPNETFETVVVARDELHAVVPFEHPAAKMARAPASALSDDPFIMSTAGCEPMIRAAAGETHLDVRFRIRDTETIVAMVGRGMGVAIIPRLALSDEPPHKVAFVPIEGARIRQVALAVRRQEANGSAARAFLKVAADQLQELPARV